MYDVNTYFFNIYLLKVSSVTITLILRVIFTSPLTPNEKAGACLEGVPFLSFQKETILHFSFSPALNPFCPINVLFFP